MKEHYNKVLRDSDARVARFMEIQILDRNDPFFGGFPSADSIAEPKVAIYHLTTMTACCLNADSKWHLDAEVLRRILLALVIAWAIFAVWHILRHGSCGCGGTKSCGKSCSGCCEHCHK